jgi:ABC-type transport system involved in multi-copper enzyme maturation permease subunit
LIRKIPFLGQIAARALHRAGGSASVPGMDALWKNDLPERFDPMTVKELRQSLRRGSFVYPFLAIHGFAVVAMAAEFQSSPGSVDLRFAGMLNPYLLVASGPFWALVTVICLFVMPFGGIALMRQELEEGNHELLLLTKLNRWKVVRGKFLTLWGMSALTFVSLLPYVVVRYLVGGIEWWHEAACATTVLGGSALMCAGVIGASAFRGLGARIAILALYLTSAAIGCAVPLVASAMVSGGCGKLYHLHAVAAVVSYSVIGLALARSRLRLVVHAFEVKPSGMLVGLLIFAPFVIAMATAFTLGHGGFAGLLAMALVAWRSDVTPRAPKWVPVPIPNLPAGSGVPGATPPPLPPGT